ncbi:Cytidine deaminase [Rubripirellula amarantea]|uniref:Cytidine deaminase n=1 Tax=Rubripirellula amarantea TaxID=2527999 RepID=A0A5C5WTS9_9BACT|nr:cytidine deaminase [Rubripirellula amarantea]TWT54086.1 Cytidine deaminase [Rubripirellula amarantea]
MSEIKSTDIDRLVRRATQARDHAYAPHSHFYVGSAVLVEDGQIVDGCNVENASYSLCMCAERTAAAAAVASGHRNIRAVAVASIGGVSPCGACRQFLAEFNYEMVVICVNVIDGSRRTFKLSSLLPEAFDATHLPAQS